MRDTEFNNRIRFNLLDTTDKSVTSIENEYGKRKMVQVEFVTAGCNMRKRGSCWNCNYGISGKKFTKEKYIESFKDIIKQVSGNELVLGSYGSITDTEEFDLETLKEIIKIAIDSGRFQFILLETHISKIPEELVQYIYNINNSGVQLGFEVGIESMNPEHRKLINKIGVSNDKLIEVYEMLRKYGMTLDINLIYGLPFMSENERMEDLISSVKEISKNMPEAEIVIFLMSVKENTKMEAMYKDGEYRLPNPWGLIEATKQILEDKEIENLIAFSWFGEKQIPNIKEQTCYTCLECKELIVECLRNINGTFDVEERKGLVSGLIDKAKSLKCGCYDKFLESNGIIDGKNPRIKI